MKPHSFYANLKGPLDPSTCAQEPIHQPGAILPHGVLLASRRGRTVIWSENAASLLGEAPVSGCDPGAYFSRLTGLEAPAPTQRTHGVDVQGQRWSLARHSNDQGLEIWELEPVPAPFAAFESAASLLSHIHTVRDIGDFCRSAAQGIQKILGYDRVMLYRFDASDNGEILAESVSENTTVQFLGLHFPEADIPVQARRLYLKNVIREIPDVLYEPSPLRSKEALPPLDLSYSPLRSVSRIHCDYLSNMKLRATLTVSLVVEGRLWGLIACHHYQPRPANPELRAVASFIGEALSARLGQILHHRRTETEALARQSLSGLMGRLGEAEDHRQAVIEALPGLQQLFDAQGIVLIDPELPPHQAGEALDEVCIEALAQAMKDPEKEITCSDRVAEALPSAALDAQVAGAMLLRPKALPFQILIWRAEVLRFVQWGSNPDKQVTVNDGVPRLSPEGSFGVFRESMRGRSRAWSQMQLEIAAALTEALTQSLAARSGQMERRVGTLKQEQVEKDTFLAILSHELRNPLGAMLGWTTLLVEDRVPEERLKRAYTAVHRNALVQKRLIDDLLDVSRIANGKLILRKETLDPASVLEAALDVTQALFSDKEIKVIQDLSPTAPIEGDAQRLQQVLWNLMSNAAKYTPPGGEVVLRVYQRGQRIHFEVQDKGAGIPKEAIPTLFQRFSQVADGQHNGLGLGLAIAHGLVDLHRGELVASSAGEGLGSTFSFSLPAVEAMEGVEDPATPLPEHSLAGLELMVIDDELDGADFVALRLRLEGARVKVFSGAMAALSSLEERKVDLILCDINMPVMDGHAFIEALGKHKDPELRAIPVVACTAYAQASDRIAVYRSGFCAHLIKPIDQDEMLALISAVTRS